LKTSTTTPSDHSAVNDNHDNNLSVVKMMLPGTVPSLAPVTAPFTKSSLKTTVTPFEWSADNDDNDTANINGISINDAAE
jgi:hypothetical protein